MLQLKSETQQISEIFRQFLRWTSTNSYVTISWCLLDQIWPTVLAKARNVWNFTQSFRVSTGQKNVVISQIGLTCWLHLETLTLYLYL